MSHVSFLHLSSDSACKLVQNAQQRVLYCAPGVQQSLAAAFVNVRKKLGREAVRIVLDVSDSTARMGYGEFDAISLLIEGDVDVRVEPGLRAGVIVCDERGYALFTPPMLIETPDDEHIGPNALAMDSSQVRSVVEAMFPRTVTAGMPPVPQIGKDKVSGKDLQQVKESLDANPPQKFDLARKVNVFNAYIEFVELRLTGLHISKHTVQLPRDLVLALQDDATARRLLTRFKLVSNDSKVAKEANEVEQRVRSLRERFTRSLGDGLGSVILRSKRQEFANEVDAIRAAIGILRAKVVERLDKEISESRKKLVEGLLPAAKKSVPQALQAQISGKPSVEVLRRFLSDELARVFPTAQSLIGEMRLEWVPKGVTYETLSNSAFQERVREAFPYEDWDKPFREFEAAPASGQTRGLFD